ncbi:MAG: GreA/GreB family elongation factor [bacterium]|nr:GreA/GreB family elongation factor [bacterium]
MNTIRVITNSDRFRLGQLIASEDTKRVTAQSLLDDLEWRVEESKAVPDELISDDVVTMNSTVRLVHIDSGAEWTCTVVYPEDVDLVDNGISVLGRLGSSLIGCEVDDLATCEIQSRSGPWRIVEIVFQPKSISQIEL